MSEKNFTGRTVVVTGAGSGIGRACALGAAERGATVVVADRNGVAAAAVAAEIVDAAGQAIAVDVDVTKPADCETMAETAVAETGRLDVLIAAAGISAAPLPDDPSVHDGTAADLSWSTDQWRRVLEVNLDGLMYTDRAVARRMIAAGGGSIVNIASISAAWTSGQATAYSVSKSGAWMLTKALAIEWAGHGIRVNAVGPGFTRTPMTAVTRADERAHRDIVERTPMGRFGEPFEIAEAALFLAGDAASFITGTIVYVDGGFNAFSR